MARTLPLGLAPEWDRDFTVMVGVSALLHAALAALVAFVITRAPPPALPLQAYTVELTDPSALGGRLAFGPLDRPLGRPARIAPAAGGAPEGPPRTGEPAAPSSEQKPPEPVKVAEAPPPTTPPATAPPATLAPPKAAAPPTEVEKPRPVESAKPKPVETVKAAPTAKPQEPGLEPREKPKAPEPKPPEPKPEPENKAETRAVPKPKPPPAQVEAKQPPKPREAIKPDVARAASMAGAVKADEPRAAAVKTGEAKTPPAAPATGGGGAGSGGSAEEKVDEKFAAAAEHWRSRMASAGGGLGGAEGQRGPIGDGASEAGGGGTVVGPEFLAYKQRVSSIIKQHWVETDRKSGLVARVYFEISPEGELSNIRLERSSGDKAYDLSVLRAVQRSGPLPPPPEKYRDDFHEMWFDFHPEEAGQAAQ
jgi:colicin import membrane protein